MNSRLTIAYTAKASVAYLAITCVRFAIVRCHCCHHVEYTNIAVSIILLFLYFVLLNYYYYYCYTCFANQHNICVFPLRIGQTESGLAVRQVTKDLWLIANINSSNVKTLEIIWGWAETNKISTGEGSARGDTSQGATLVQKLENK